MQISDELLDNPYFCARHDRSLTRVTKLVFPGDTNSYDTLFGGKALAWMDEVAAIASMRFSRQQTVTVSLDKTDFKKPIPSGSFVELVAQVVDVGRSSMKIMVEVFIESKSRDLRQRAIQGLFTFVTIDETRNPVPVNWNRPLDEHTP